MQGAQIRRNEAYLLVHCNEWGCSATQQMEFLLCRHDSRIQKHTNFFTRTICLLSWESTGDLL